MKPATLYKNLYPGASVTFVTGVKRIRRTGWISDKQPDISGQSVRVVPYGFKNEMTIKAEFIISIQHTDRSEAPDRMKLPQHRTPENHKRAAAGP